MSNENQGTTFDWSDAFDKHLDQMSPLTPETERQAAINIYGRLVSARKILSTGSVPQQTTEMLMSIFEQLNEESRLLASLD